MFTDATSLTTHPIFRPDFSRRWRRRVVLPVWVDGRETEREWKRAREREWKRAQRVRERACGRRVLFPDPRL
jgi:hypothetical protein